MRKSTKKQKKQTPRIIDKKEQGFLITLLFVLIFTLVMLVFVSVKNFLPGKLLPSPGSDLVSNIPNNSGFLVVSLGVILPILFMIILVGVHLFKEIRFKKIIKYNLFRILRKKR